MLHILFETITFIMFGTCGSPSNPNSKLAIKPEYEGNRRTAIHSEISQPTPGSIDRSNIILHGQANRNEVFLMLLRVRPNARFVVLIVF